jgi:hypothetical protein
MNLQSPRVSAQIWCRHMTPPADSIRKQTLMKKRDVPESVPAAASLAKRINRNDVAERVVMAKVNITREQDPKGYRVNVTLSG